MQERDAERRRQLRERARQLIAEARSGVKISDMSLLDPTNMERSKGSKAGSAGGQDTYIISIHLVTLVLEKSKNHLIALQATPTNNQVYLFTIKLNVTVVWVLT